MTLSAEFRRLWSQAVHKGTRAVLQPALVGIVTPAGDKRVTDSKRPGWVHVRLGPDGLQGQTTARNDSGIPLRWGAPILVWEIEGVLSIYGTDPARWLEYAGETGMAAVPFHHHRRGSGMEYLLEMLLLEAGHVQWAGSGFNVEILPLFYPYGGVWHYYPGETLDLSSYVTATADYWNWVKIGIDPETNAAVAVAGADMAGVHLLTLADLAAVPFVGYIPLAGYRVSESDSDLRGTANRMVDIGFWRGREFVYPEGMAGGQILYGGTDSGDGLELHSTSHATKGIIQIEPDASVTGGPKVAIGTVSVPEFVNLYLFGVNGAYMRLHSTTDRAQLHLLGDADNFVRLMLEQNTTGRWEIGGAEDTSGNFIIGGTDMTQRYLVIEPGGNIGFGGIDDPQVALEVLQDHTSATRGIMASIVGDEAGRPAFVIFRKARGTRATPTIVNDGDRLGAIACEAYDGDSYHRTSRIDFIVNGTPADGDVPTDILFQANGGFGTADTNLAVRSNGDLEVRGKLGLAGQVPTGMIHGHDGVGGYLVITLTGIDGTAQIILPDGPGDVTQMVSYESIVTDGVSVTQHNSGTLTPTDMNGSIYNDSGNNVNLTCVSAGALQVRRNAGSGTYTAILKLMWI